MEIGFFLVALAVVVLAGSALAGRIGFPAPLLLIAIGVVGAYIPGMHEVRLEPEVVLLGLLPPLLYAAAVQTSLVDFRANLKPILLLSVGLVVFTTFGIGLHRTPSVSSSMSFAGFARKPSGTSSWVSICSYRT